MYVVWVTLARFEHALAKSDSFTMTSNAGVRGIISEISNSEHSSLRRDTMWVRAQLETHDSGTEFKCFAGRSYLKVYYAYIRGGERCKHHRNHEQPIRVAD